jgi:enoyl-CoA hydratase/carnithine racemase
VEAALDEVERAEGARALVTTATGKFFSNGLDLDWLFAHADQHEAYVVRVHALFARVLSLPLITVAALQGPTFAAGAMLSPAHDFRVMRAGRGFWCLPEADIGIPFTHGMSALIQARLAPQVAHEAMTTGRRYGGVDARRATPWARSGPGCTRPRSPPSAPGRTPGVDEQRGPHTIALAPVTPRPTIRVFTSRVPS